jgi:hypothetical protein
MKRKSSERWKGRVQKDEKDEFRKMKRKSSEESKRKKKSSDRWQEKVQKDKVHENERFIRIKRKSLDDRNEDRYPSCVVEEVEPSWRYVWCIGAVTKHVFVPGIRSSYRTPSPSTWVRTAPRRSTRRTSGTVRRTTTPSDETPSRSSSVTLVSSTESTSPVITVFFFS